MSLKQFAVAALLMWMTATSANAADITGKVMGVFHEPVNVNNKWMDKVSVVVASCANPSQWVKAFYSPGAVSEDNALGFLYRDQANAARAMVMKNQYMNSINGHVTLSLNEQNQIMKTTFWGYNWECGKDVSAPGSGASAYGGGASAQPAQQPAKPPASGAGAAINPLKRFGF